MKAKRPPLGAAVLLLATARAGSLVSQTKTRDYADVIN